MKKTKTEKSDYLTPATVVVLFYVESNILTGSNEDIGGKDLAPLRPDIPLIPDNIL